MKIDQHVAGIRHSLFKDWALRELQLQSFCKSESGYWTYACIYSVFLYDKSLFKVCFGTCKVTFSPLSISFKFIYTFIHLFYKYLWCIVFNFCRDIVSVCICRVHEIFWYRHAMHNNHIMENGISIPVSTYPSSYKQSNYTLLAISKCTIKLLLTIVTLLCDQIIGLIHSFYYLYPLTILTLPSFQAPILFPAFVKHPLLSRFMSSIVFIFSSHK